MAIHLPYEVLLSICEMALEMQPSRSGVYSLMLASRSTFHPASQSIWADIDAYSDERAQKLQILMKGFADITSSLSSNLDDTSLLPGSLKRMLHYLSSIRKLRSGRYTDDVLIPYMAGLQEIHASHSFLFTHKALQELHVKTGRPFTFKIYPSKDRGEDENCAAVYPKAATIRDLSLPNWGNVLSMPFMEKLKELRISVNMSLSLPPLSN
ncbi:hypothetical protein HDU97_008155 [Phlyctochytrium planicorne]|nr:hypothetical protein HDU97_008155 [Phlyctochytrium planicorne]